MKEITIFERYAETISGISQKTGNKYSFRKQSAYLDEGKPVLSETSIMLNDDDNPLEIGVYILQPKAIYIDRNSRISINVSPENLKLKTNEVKKAV